MRLPFFFIIIVPENPDIPDSPELLEEMKHRLIILLASLTLTGCFSEGTLTQQPTTLTDYQHKPTEAKLLALAKSYADAINLNKQQGVIHPGLYADYGVALARLGCYRQADIMFNNEQLLFPVSASYISILKDSLIPAAYATSLADTSAIDLATLDTIHITLTPEEQALLDSSTPTPNTRNSSGNKRS